MGAESLLYICTQGQAHTKEVILGDRRNPCNPFRWDHVWLHIPGSGIYDSSIPLVPKVCINIPLSDPVQLAVDMFTYVDDMQPNGGMEED